MSDALTDLYRDQQRSSNFSNFHDILAKYLKGFVSIKAVEDAADAIDAIRGGYWSGQTNVADGVRQLVEGLKSGDRRIWLGLLRQSYKGYFDPVYSELKKLSPFKDKVLIGVDYGRGFSRTGFEIEDVMASIISSSDMKTYDCDDYVVVLDKEIFSKAVAEWIGHFNYDGPRPANWKAKNREVDE